MATKLEMRGEIAEMEPENSVIKQSSATHPELVRELKSARRRKASREASRAAPVEAKYRTEDTGTLLSWRFFLVDGDLSIGDLQFGHEVPDRGSLHVLDGTTCRVSRTSNGLGIIAGDLPVRESFDPRRRYLTPNGTPIVFKRTDGRRIVLWSYKAQSEIAIGKQVPLERTDAKAKPIASVPKRMTQKLLAAYVIAQNPGITGKELTQKMRDAFPNAAIGDRHGPHYLSHSRNSKLPEPPDTDPRTWADSPS